MNRRFFMKMLGAAPVAATVPKPEWTPIAELKPIAPIQMEILYPAGPSWLMSGAFVANETEFKEDVVGMFKKLTPMLLMGLLGLYFY